MQKQNKTSIINVFKNLFASYDKESAVEQTKTIHNNSVELSNDLQQLAKNNESFRLLLRTVSDLKADAVERYKMGAADAHYIAGVDAVYEHIKNTVNYNSIRDLDDIIDFGNIEDNDVGESILTDNIDKGE